MTDAHISLHDHFARHDQHDQEQDGHIKEALLRTDDQFRQMVMDHHELDERLRVISALAHLTEPQQYEESSLKKRKLALKDRIESVVRRQHLTASEDGSRH